MRSSLIPQGGLERPADSPPTAPRPALLLAGGAVAAVGAAVLGTWAEGETALAALVRGWRVMVPSTAFGFVCIGLGIAGFAIDRPWSRRAAPIAAAAAVVLPLVTLVEYVGGTRLGVEHWLGISVPGTSPVAGRMSPVAALSMLLLGLALAALPRPGPIAQGVVRLAAGTALALSWLAVLVLAFDTARLADAPRFPGLAVLTVVLLAVSSGAVLASSKPAMARLRGAHFDTAIAPGTWLAAFAMPLALGQARELLEAWTDPGLAAGIVVSAFAMLLAAVVWRTLARLQTFEQQRERLLAELERRVDERTEALALANQQLYASEGRLREADRRKDEFLATLAHELRNPLAPMRTALEIVRAGAPLEGPAAQAHGVIDRQLRHLVRLIDDLLDVSRITANKLELRLERLAIAEIFQHGIETARGEIDRGGHTLVVTPPAEPVYVLGDPTRLTQILSNLLHNAGRYTPRGGRIALSAMRRGDSVEIRVADSGIGIAAEHLPRLFEKFSQVVPGFERGGRGLGLGLALVRGLVSLHGGTVTATSAGPGRGSEFVVRLPAAEAPPVVAASPPAALSSGSRRVLVVDDNVDNADTLAMYLRGRGHLVETAYDGEAAWQAAERFRPDVILLDLGLPKVSGHAVCESIRTQPWGATMRIIAQTGWGQEGDRERSRAAGFDEHLVKPVDPALLAAMVVGPTR
ncbi:MAG: ATP-binding protein [Vicinamibacterales bacterium]